MLVNNFISTLNNQQMKGISAKIHYGYAIIHAAKINNPLNCLEFKGLFILNPKSNIRPDSYGDPK